MNFVTNQMYKTNIIFPVKAAGLEVIANILETEVRQYHHLLH